MSDTKEQDSPTADEIVDDLAEEMGVDDSEPEEEQADEASDDASAEEDSANETSEGGGGSGDMSGIEGVFAVKKGSKSKKKKRKKKKKKKKKSSVSADTDGIFTPGGDDDDIDLDDIDLGLDDDLQPKNPVNKLLIIVIILLIGGGLVGAHFATLDDTGHGLFHDIGLVLTGEYRDHVEREKQRMEEEYMEAQLEAMPRFGNLAITGRPRYSLIRINGEIPFGQTTQGQWRELRTSPQTIIQDLSIDEPHEIEVELAGHLPFEVTLHEDMWEQRGGGEYFYEVSANLQPEDGDAYREFSARTTVGEGDGPFLGKLSFNTEPEGAVIMINGYLVRDEDGEPVTTPAEFEEYWTLDIDFEEIGEENEEFEDVSSIRDIDEFDINLDDFELRERDLRVDTPPNEGVPVELFIPEEGDEEPFIYGTQLYRNMWDCQWKDDDERDQISDDAPIQEHCNYVYEFDVNFPELSDYIEAREEERERIAKERANAAELIEGQAPDGQ